MYDTQTNVQEGRVGEVREEDEGTLYLDSEGAGGAPIEEGGPEKFTAFIYVLMDEFGVIRYVGKTINPPQRLQYHFYANRRSHKDNWIKSMLTNGKKPTMEVLEEVECECDLDWHEAEMFWIAYFRFLGLPLTNLENGGQGAGRMPPETRAKMSATRKGKPTGIPMPSHLKETLLKSHLGVPMPEETKLKISETNKRTGAIERLAGYKPPAGWNLGIPSSEETKAKQSATHKLIGTGKGPKTPEHREKLRQALLGKPLSEERKAKLRGPRGPRGPNIRTLRKQGLAPPKDQPPSETCTS